MLKIGQQFVNVEGRIVKVEDTLRSLYKGAYITRYRLSGETRFITEGQVRAQYPEVVKQSARPAPAAQGR